MRVPREILSFCLAMFCVAALSAIDYPHEIQAHPVRDRLLLSSLNGTWDVSFAGRPEPATCRVPGNWETQGLASPGYSATIPDNQATYRRTFDADPSWQGRHVVLRFDGVMYAYSVTLNGNLVAEDVTSAYNLHQFDVTSFLRPRANALEVVVKSRFPLSGFDKCDDWSIAGITRDVDLYSLDEDYLEDVFFRTTAIDERGTATVALDVRTASFAKGVRAVSVTAALYDATRRRVIAFQGKPKDGVAAFVGTIPSPALWTAETPNLHTLVVDLLDDAGNRIQRHEERVGVRTVRAQGTRILVNGRAVKLKGVCLNEIDPKVGRAFTAEDFRRRLVQMKACHVNFIRTAHYPFAPAFYELCDEMGFYVCDEIPYSSCSRGQLHEPATYPTLEDRAVRTVRRDRNRPCVLLWSVGNENPYPEANLGPILDLVKKMDPTRLRTLPHAQPITPRNGEKKVKAFFEQVRDRVDVLSVHYAKPKDLLRLADWLGGAKPLIQTEYAHAMGGGFNDFQDAVRLFLSDDRFVGGSIWCWHDQGLLGNEAALDYYAAHANSWPTSEAKPRLWNSPPEFQGVAVDPRHFIDSRGSYGSDGVVYANGYPKESWQLVRKLYTPVWVAFDGTSFRIENRHAFRSLAGWTLVWNGNRVPLCAVPGGTEKIEVQTADAAFVDVRVEDPQGARIWETTFRGTGSASRPYAVRPCSDVKDLLARTLLKVGRKPGISYLCRIHGKVSELEKKDRAGATKKEKVEWTPYLIRPVVIDFSETGEGRFAATCRYSRNEDAASSEYFEARFAIKVNRDGALKFNYTLTASPAVDTWCSEIGFAFLCPDATRVDWDGDGPWTSTPGKSLHATPGLWALHRDDLHFPGNRAGLNWALLSNGTQGWAVTPATGDVSFGLWKDAPYVSVNVFVSGYGTKFGDGAGLKSAKGACFRGTFTSATVQIVEPLETVVPDRPFTSHYGW